MKRTRRPRALGMPVTRVIKRRDFHVPRIDLKKVAKQVGDVAERVEHVSEDVRAASAQAKRMTKNLS